MRITSTMQNQNIMTSMMNNQSIVSSLQTQLASGQKINTASDNPSVIPSIMNADKTLNKIETYKNNITYLNGEIEVTDGALSSVNEIIQRVKELTLQAANATNGSTQLKSINNEIKQLKEQVVALGNTSYQDSYIFSGNKTNTTPFVINDDGSISYNGTPGTDDYKRDYSIADGVNVNINVAGDNVLGYSNLKSAGPPPEYEGEGLLHAINNLTNLLDADPPEYDKIRSQLDGLETAQNNVLAARTEIGGAQSRLSMTKEQHENSKVTYKSIQSSLQEVDISELVTNLSTQQVALQASLYAGSQLMNTSLLNYM